MTDSFSNVMLENACNFLNVKHQCVHIGSTHDQDMVAVMLPTIPMTPMLSSSPLGVPGGDPLWVSLGRICPKYENRYL